MTKYLVPQEVYNRIQDLIEEDMRKIQALSREIAEAKEYGDLSENATYDSLTMRQNDIKNNCDNNISMMEFIEVGTTEEIRELNNNLFCTVTYELTDVSHGVLLEKNKVMIVPPFEIKIKDSLFCNSELGACLLNAEGESTTLMFKYANKIFSIKIKKVEPYSPERLRFENGSNNINSTVSDASAEL